MASSMALTTSFFGGAVAAKPATATTRRSQLAVRASMDLEKVMSAGESSNTRRGVMLAGMAAATAASSVVKAAMAGMPGGWTTVDNPGAPEYLQLATFAVSEFNKKNNLSLILESVFRVDTQSAAGTNYRLFLTARDESRKSNNYVAVVFSQAVPTSLQLRSFDPLLK